MTAIALPLALLAFGSVAAAVALHRWGWRGLPLAAGAVGLAPAMAFGPLSLATFAWSWRGRIADRSTLLLAALGLSAALVGLTPRRMPLPARRREPLPGWLSFAIVSAAGLALCVVTAVAPLALRAVPIGLYDAHAIWNAHARFLFRAQEDPSALFREMRRGHPDYPLFVPATVAGQWSLLGWEGEPVPQVTSAAFLLGTALVIGAALAARHRPIAGCLAMALYLTTPNALRWGFAQCADVPLSYLFVLAAVGMAGVLTRDADAPLPPVLSGFLLGLLAWTKNEGMLLAAVLLGTGVLAAWRNGSRACGGLWRALAVGAGTPLLALFLFKLRWSPGSELRVFLDGASARLPDPIRWLTVATAFVGEFDPASGWPRWGTIWPLALAGCAWSALALRRQRDPVRATLLLTLAGALATWCAVYVIGPRDLPWQLRTSLDRLLLQLLPLALICGLDWPARHDDRPSG